MKPERNDAPEIDEETVCSLARLIGDQEKARARSKNLSLLVKKIEEENPEGVVDVFRAAADPCRFKILKLLSEGELCVCEIMIALKKPQSSISHHLSIMKEAGLVKERRDGKWSYYRISDGAVTEMIKEAEALKKNKT